MFLPFYTLELVLSKGNRGCEHSNVIVHPGMIQSGVFDIAKHPFPEPMQLRYNCFMHEQLCKYNDAVDNYGNLSRNKPAEKSGLQ